jgi:hypothetical protein
MPRRHTGETGVQLHTFLTLVLHRDEWSTSCSCHFTPGKECQSLSNGTQGGPQTQSVHFEEHKNHWPLPGFEPPTIRPVA